MLQSAILVSVMLASASFGLTASVPPDAETAEQPQKPKLSAHQMGDIYMARKMFREAIDQYRDAENKASNADKSVLEDKIGIAWHQLGDLNAAMKAYQRAVKLDANYADAINNMGTIYYAEKRYGRAVSRYRRAIEITPESAAVWSNLGTAYYEQKKFAEMADAYAKAMSIDPTVFDAKSGPGTQMQDRAVQDKARYHFEMAKVFAKAGKNELALQYLRRSMEEGFKDKEKIVKEPEFASLRETPEFKDLMTLEPRVL